MSARRIIALISQKGGSGKTTATMQLAAGLAARGRRVAIVDLDPQQSATRWSEAAPANAPFPAAMSLPDEAGSLKRTLRRAAREADIVLLDCPPSIEHPRTLEALEHTDFAIVPVVPSPTDLWSTRGIERMILDRGLAGALLPNRVTHTTLAEEVLSILNDFELPVLDAPLFQRSAYALSAVRGGSVFSLGHSALAARQEVERLAAAVLTHLKD